MAIFSVSRHSYLTILFASVIVGLLVSVLAQEKGHGETCENDVECNSDLFMECYLDPDTTNGTCQCLGEAQLEMKFFNEICVSAANKFCGEGQDCVPNAECKENSTGIEICTCLDGYSEGYDWGWGTVSGFCWASYNTSCDPEDNAESPDYCDNTIGLICDSTENVCKCEAEGTSLEWYPKSDRCVRLNRYGETCEDSTDCDNEITPFLKCQDSGFEGLPLFCECKGEGTGEMYYDRDQSKCLSGAGNDCDDTAGPSCIYNSDCNSDKKCECKDGYTPGSWLFQAYRCYLTWGSACDREENDWKEGTCNSDEELRCDQEENLCRCSGEGDYEGWNNKTKKCSPLVGGSCEIPADCPDKANCITDNNFQRCECQSAYSRTKDRYCKRAIDENCVQNPTEDTERCNGDERLSCSSAGKCTCVQGTVYQKYSSDNSARCLIPAGGTCDLGSYGSLSRSCILFADCVPNGGGAEIGVCQCEEGYKPSNDNTICTSGAGGLVVANSLFLFFIGSIILFLKWV